MPRARTGASSRATAGANGPTTQYNTYSMEMDDILFGDGHQLTQSQSNTGRSTHGPRRGRRTSSRSAASGTLIPGRRGRLLVQQRERRAPRRTGGSSRTCRSIDFIATTSAVTGPYTASFSGTSARRRGWRVRSVSSFRCGTISVRAGAGRMSFFARSRGDGEGDDDQLGPGVPFNESSIDLRRNHQGWGVRTWRTCTTAGTRFMADNSAGAVALDTVSYTVWVNPGKRGSRDDGVQRPGREHSLVGRAGERPFDPGDFAERKSYWGNRG